MGLTAGSAGVFPGEPVSGDASQGSHRRSRVIHSEATLEDDLFPQGRRCRSRTTP